MKSKLNKKRLSKKRSHRKTKKQSKKIKTNQNAGGGHNRGPRGPVEQQPTIIVGNDAIQGFIESNVNELLFTYNDGLSIVLNISYDFNNRSSENYLNYENRMNTFNQPRKAEMINTINFCRSTQGDRDYLYSLTLNHYNPSTLAFIHQQTE